MNTSANSLKHPPSAFDGIPMNRQRRLTRLPLLLRGANLCSHNSHQISHSHKKVAILAPCQQADNKVVYILLVLFYNSHLRRHTKNNTITPAMTATATGIKCPSMQVGICSKSSSLMTGEGVRPTIAMGPVVRTVSPERAS